MSIFEFIMVMVSLILALALAQALRGATEIVTSGKRYLPHGLWLLVVIMMILQTWWAYWDWNVISDWQITTYVAALVFPIALFVAVYMLVPATRSGDIDWRAHFFEVRIWFFATIMFLSAYGAFVNVHYFDATFFNFYRVFHAGFLLICMSALLTRNEKIHLALPILMILILIASQLVVRMQIGAFIRS